MPKQVLVLNASYEPLSLVSVRRAVVLLLREKAELLEATSQMVRSASRAMPRPLVIRLVHYVRLPHRRVPATRTAIRQSPLYQQGGPLHLFVVQLAEGYAVPRPRTPAYPVISASFRQAFADIRNGMAVQQALDRAVASIDEDIRDNRGYPLIDTR